MPLPNKLDITHCFELKTLVCYHNKLTSLDVSNNAVLEWLDCSENQLTTLDVSNNTSLYQLNLKNMANELIQDLIKGTAYLSSQFLKSANCKSGSMEYIRFKVAFGHAFSYL